VAEITADDGSPWFGPYLPGKFVLGDPAGRDAALHAIQACIPHRRILPTGIDRMMVCPRESGVRFVRAKERWREGNDFMYDVEVSNAAGEIIERWDGLRLRAMEIMAASEPWPVPLLAPYLERRLEEWAGAGAPVRVALECGLREERPARTDAVIQQALGKAARLWRRPDGKPVFLGEEDISAAHTEGLTLAVAGGTACDLEVVAARTLAAWGDLLGEEKYRLAERLAREQVESLDTAATRVWTVIECLKKAGQPPQSPLVFESGAEDGWMLLRSGALKIATCVTVVQNLKSPLVVAIAFKTAVTPVDAGAGMLHREIQSAGG
jgi:enediyne polyketide synthase